MPRGYNYAVPLEITTSGSVEDAVRVSVENYMRHQLGWSIEQCTERVAAELSRAIPKRVFAKLTDVGWQLEGARLLDLGAGQGGAVLEALIRRADAYGVEPGTEFRTLGRMRLRDAGYDPERIVSAPGEELPFPDNTFDYVITLQVLEHVPDPRPLMEETLRVLKPGGRCYVSCENYLSFMEQHYRVPWLPMLPKWMGALYLRALGRNPAFLRDYVYYSTYPQIWGLARDLGFDNVTWDAAIRRFDTPSSLRRPSARIVAGLAQALPMPARARVARTLLHLNACWRVGVRLHLSKPRRT